MSDPISLTAEAIAVLVATKTFEKTGEKLGENVWKLVANFLKALKKKSPSTAVAIQTVAANRKLAKVGPNKHEINTLIHEVEEAAKNDAQVQKSLDELCFAVTRKPNTIINMSQLAEKIGIVIQSGENIHITNTNNF